MRKARNASGKTGEIIARVQMKGGQLVKFVADILSQHLENPTIVLIEADVWRNQRSQDDTNTLAWFQLTNEYLFEKESHRRFSMYLRFRPIAELKQMALAIARTNSLRV